MLSEQDFQTLVSKCTCIISGKVKKRELSRVRRIFTSNMGLSPVLGKWLFATLKRARTIVRKFLSMMKLTRDGIVLKDALHCFRKLLSIGSHSGYDRLKNILKEFFNVKGVYSAKLMYSPLTRVATLKSIAEPTVHKLEINNDWDKIPIQRVDIHSVAAKARAIEEAMNPSPARWTGSQLIERDSLGKYKAAEDPLKRFVPTFAPGSGVRTGPADMNRFLRTQFMFNHRSPAGEPLAPSKSAIPEGFTQLTNAVNSEAFKEAAAGLAFAKRNANRKW